MDAMARLPAISPLIAAIPANPLRALFPYAARPGMLNLASGHPSQDAYDLVGLKQALGSAGEDFNAWTYGPSGGDPGLLSALEGLGVRPDHGQRALITSGAQQGVDLALRTLAPPGTTVLVPEPVYPAILSLCAAAGLHTAGYDIRAAPGEPGNLDAALTLPGVRALYALPTFSNPTGLTWTEGERRALLAKCAARDLPIVEDDPYRELWFDAPPPLSLHSLAAGIDGAIVIHTASLSKVMAPGLRLGWAIAPGPIADAMQEARQAGDLQPNAMAQRIAAHYIASGRVPEHLKRVRRLYGERHAALRNILGAAGLDMPAVGGGMFVFATLPDGQPLGNLFDRAVAQKVMFAPGPAFAREPGSGRFGNQLRLCFAGLPLAQIEDAAQRLVGALKEPAPTANNAGAAG